MNFLVVTQISKIFFILIILIESEKEYSKTND